MKFPNDYMERLYGGWLGKVIGVIHGANIEGWSYERIEQTFGEITDYPYFFKHFAADDDINGPALFMRALDDFEPARLTAQEMGHTLRNYTGEGHGFFWWGGYGVSTEHTAYMNLKNGVPAPQSGSIEQNGRTTAEQIGGQIFSDCWGLVCPGDLEKAAELAGMMSSVTHGGDGIRGGRFIAACIASAFVRERIEDIVEDGLPVIEETSDYAQMARDVIAFCKQHPDDWREAFAYVKDKYGYQHYEGVCHIIPNAAVIVLSLLYGQGDFSRTINICNMCGWDTDCNVGNVGTILGVLNGPEGIERKWTTPINDFVCCSGIVGSLNLQTIPQLVTDTARLAVKLNDEEIPGWEDILQDGSTHHLHFELPGSTHALEWKYRGNERILLANTSREAYKGRRSLQLTAPSVFTGTTFDVFFLTYGSPSDFDDSRYDPDISPTVYPGQTVEAWLKLDESVGTGLHVRLFAEDDLTGRRLYSNLFILNGEWQKVSYRIPYADDFIIGKIGMEYAVSGDSSLREKSFSLKWFLDEMKIYGPADYAIDFASQRMEKWNALHQTVSQLTYLRGIWRLEDGRLAGGHGFEPAECYTGSHRWNDYLFRVKLKPLSGDHHSVLFRVQGAMRSYAVGLAPGQTIALHKNFEGYRELESKPFPWKHGIEYEVEVRVQGSLIEVSIDGNAALRFRDEDAPYLRGSIGFGNSGGSRTAYSSYQVRSLV
ncbi:ADP-ribosylglycohydrolase family protein [Paenibacillus antibioticophila]|uniref:ADP-ribosylglycohydrolase family protein n=1 Tax=Paenibacillus antibioticophila TaxID=1274374 RepID=UPI0005C9E720|nr:ADP-ribosylglycohydrolase family protein [Paenibacillus antibioticophila]